MQWKNEAIKLLIIIVILGIISYLISVFVQILIKYIPQLSTFQNDITTAIDVIVVGVGGYYIIRIIQQVLSYFVLSRVERGLAGIIKFTLDVIFYSILVIAILAVLHVNLTGVVVGGAVGGIIIGLAIQTVAQNLLSGLLITSSKTLKPGDAVSMISWIWGSPIIGEVTKVSLLFTEVKTINGNLVKIPNSAFLGNTVFQKLEAENSLIYPLQVTVNADVEAKKVMEKVKEKLKDYFDDNVPQIFFTAKTGGTNVFTVIIHLSEINKLNQILDIINKTFDEAYWEAKK